MKSIHRAPTYPTQDIPDGKRWRPGASKTAGYHCSDHRRHRQPPGVANCQGPQSTSTHWGRGVLVYCSSFVLSLIFVFCHILNSPSSSPARHVLTTESHIRPKVISDEGFLDLGATRITPGSTWGILQYWGSNLGLLQAKQEFELSPQLWRLILKLIML